MNQSEVRLHSGRTVHFRPSLYPRPSFRIFRGSGSETNQHLGLYGLACAASIKMTVEIFCSLGCRWLGWGPMSLCSAHWLAMQHGIGGTNTSPLYWRWVMLPLRSCDVMKQILTPIFFHLVININHAPLLLHTHTHAYHKYMHTLSYAYPHT